MEKLYNTLISAQNILNKNEAVVSRGNRIITVSTCYQEVEDYKMSMELSGIHDYSNNPSVEQCQQALKDRIIKLKLHSVNLEQEITAKVLEERITAKFIDEYHKTTNLSKEEVALVINQVIAQNPNLNDIDLFDTLVKSKLDDVEKSKRKHNKNSSNPLLNQIKRELEKTSIANKNKHLFSVNIEAEINILQQSSEELLKEILESLKQINQTEERNNILEVEYNCLNESVKRNVSLDKFKKIINFLVGNGYTLNIACDLIKNTPTNPRAFNDKINTIYNIINKNNQNIFNQYNLLSSEKKQFITLFQFKQAVNHFYSLNFNHDVAMTKVLEIIKNSVSFSYFYGLVSINATAEEEKRGYGSKTHIQIVYYAAQDELKKTGILSLSDFGYSSLAEEQKNKTCKEFKQWVSDLKQSLSSPASTINSRAKNNYSPSINTRPTNLTSVDNPSLQTVNKNISLSNMHNFGATCWLNSSLKFIYSFYGYETIKTAINTKLKDIDQLPTTKSQDQFKKLLLSFREIIDAMSRNDKVNIQIHAFLTNMHNYAQSLPNRHKDKNYMSNIDKLIINAFDGKGNIQPHNIKQQDANEFISFFTAFLNLNSNSNKVVKKSFREFSLTKQDLNDIGLDIITENLILEVESSGAVLDQIVQLPEESKEDAPFNLNMNYFKDFCNRANASFSSGNINSVNDYHQIPSKLKNKEKLFGDINSLEKIHLNTNYAKHKENGPVRDINRIMANLKLMLSSVKIEIIDEKTKQSYMVEAKPETMVLFVGTEKSGGHYCTATIDDNGNVFIQNDSKNTTIEEEYYNNVSDRKQLAKFTKKTTAEKLIEYIQLQKLYPTSIGFKVISKTPIKS